MMKSSERMHAGMNTLTAISAQSRAHTSETARLWGLYFTVFGVVAWGASFPIGFERALTIVVVVSWVAVS